MIKPVKALQKAVKKIVGTTGSKKTDRLLMWQERLTEARTAYAPILQQMSDRDALFSGTRLIDKNPNSRKAPTKEATHVRNIVFELIESEVSNTIPAPKVDTDFQNNEPLAVVIEEVLKSTLVRLPFEEYNDIQERTVPVQGADFFMVEWDNTIRTHKTVGGLKVSNLHAKQVIPQKGVYVLDDMDFFFVQLAQTKEYIKRRFGVDVENEDEELPDIESFDDRPADKDMVTQNIAFFKNDNGTVGRYSWVNDVVLEDYDDYQARRLDRCVECNEVKPPDSDECVCGCKKFKSVIEQGEELTEDITLSNGNVIPKMSMDMGDDGLPVMDIMEQDGLPVLDPNTKQIVQQPRMKPTVLPYYTPDVYPVIIRKNVSRFGMFLGDSDVEKIRDQQDIIKKLGTKVEEKLLTSGSFVAINKRYKKDIVLDSKECKILWIDPGDYNSIKDINLQPDISKDMQFMNEAYEFARSTLGITDSSQGKRDPTALSGVAKQQSASQAAGRLESKRTIKDAAYSRLFEVMFKFMLAYTDEPRPFVAKDRQGNKVYNTFNRYDFFEQDDAGEWFCNDQYLFTVDASGGVATDRAYMQEQARLNFQSGAFGPPESIETLLVFWQTMELLHYPGAAATKARMQEQLDEQKKLQEATAKMQTDLAAKGAVLDAGDPAKPPVQKDTKQVKAGAQR